MHMRVDLAGQDLAAALQHPTNEAHSFGIGVAGTGRVRSHNSPDSKSSANP